MDTTKKQSHKNPKESSNILSLIFFGWTMPIFLKGMRRDLEMADLYDPLKSDESERLGERLEKEWRKELKKVHHELEIGNDGKKEITKQPSLLRAILRIVWVPYMVQGLLVLLLTVSVSIIQPVLQGWIISFFESAQDSMTRNQVLVYAALLIIVTFGVILLMHHSSLRSQQIGMWVRIACCSMLYRKALRLNQAANKSGTGHVANLMSNDVARFDAVSEFLHYVWIMPVQVILTAFMMWQSVGVASLVGIVAMLLQTIPIQGYLSALGAKFRSKIAERTDERVQLMSELISGIQVVKMYTWEEPFELIVSKIRALELKFIGYTSYLRGFYLSIMVFSERVSLYLTLITFVLMGNALTAEVTFVLANLINGLQFVCGLGFPAAIILAGEAASSLERLTEFLLLDEIEASEKLEFTEKNGMKILAEPVTQQQTKRRIRIKMIKVAANWMYDQLPLTLSEVSLEIKSQSLCTVVGPVGSGKSSLLNLVLGELPVRAGRLLLLNDENDKTVISRQDTRISYTSQVPWLFAASIRDNILFGQPYDEARYQEVARVCALVRDFAELPQGDLTFVGDRGASLSGGQKARVNLARAVYRDAEIYLLDDPLSAVDTHVGRHLFEECIKGFLKDKTRILVTHQVQYLRQADSVVVLNRGTVEHHGPYEELLASNFRYLQSNETTEPEDMKHIKDAHPENSEHKTVVIVTKAGNNAEVLSEKTDDEFTDTNEEEVATGLMSSEVYWGYFLASGNLWITGFLMIIIMILGQIAASGTDYWVTYWTNEETERTMFINNSTAYTDSYSNSTLDNHRRIYLTEWQWLDEFGFIGLKPAICVYALCIFACIFLVILRNMLFMRICMKASCNLHNSMFANLLKATMRFFNTNPSGRVLNRFSKDIGSLDESLPIAMLEALHIISISIGILTMVALANYWMLVPMVIMIGLFYFTRKYYLKTAQDIRRLEGIAKSPMFSHVSSTLDGLATIRSRGASMKQLLQKEFDCYQDAHSGAWYLSIAVETTFGFVLDVISCAYIACVCFSFILMDDGDTSGGSVGLAISQSLILTGMVQHGIKQTAEVMARMTSVERVLQYTNLPSEGPFLTENPPPPTWPSKGGIVFKEVSMRYADTKPLVLKGLNLNIKPGWKVGIVGRTGAGKSSLISALFHLTGDGLEGEIALDGIDTTSIGLHELRRQISIIPQEPILFSATMRYNLDPFEQYSDSELWDSLREVELGDKIPSLDFLVAEGGVNLSVGQRQLICLARAILRSNRILVLDEATANVDPRTDALIQRTIRKRFVDCTVLTIAHRLNTIMDSDRVLVMDSGRIVEFGHPYLLLKNSDSQFAQMLRQTGSAMSEELAAIAESAQLLKPEFTEDQKTAPVSLISSKTNTNSTSENE